MKKQKSPAAGKVSKRKVKKATPVKPVVPTKVFHRITPFGAMSIWKNGKHYYGHVSGGNGKILFVTETMHNKADVINGLMAGEKVLAFVRMNEEEGE